jgi:hypothetical protein
MTDQAHQSPVVSRRWRLPKRRWLLVGLLVIGIYIVSRILSSPAEGHQEAVDQKLIPAQPTTAPAPAASTLNNQYFTLRLPVGYSLQASSTTTPGLLFNQTILKASNEGSLIINVGLSTLDGGLSENSSYRLRAENPQTYGLSSQLIGGSTVTISTRLDGSDGEVVAFWPHGNYLATVSVTDGTGDTPGGDTAGDQTVLMSLLKGWQWH